MSIRDSACTGACCARFPIGKTETHAELLQILAKRRDVVESDKIRDMLIVIPPDALAPFDTYTCKHWDKETQLCMNYEHRPNMCSDYPYDGRCLHCGMVFPRSADENCPAAL